MGKNAKRRRTAKRQSTSGMVTRFETPGGSRTIVTGAAGEDLASRQAAVHREFRDKFGRDPGPGDPLIWDPDEDEPTPLPLAKFEQMTVGFLRDAGVSSAFIYAYQQTGMMLTTENQSLFSDEDLDEWEAAVDRYEALHPED